MSLLRISLPLSRPKFLANLSAITQRDARIFQIAFLACLLSVGVITRDFSLRWEQMLLTFASGIGTQILCLRAQGRKPSGLLSPVITCFGLSILLRADSSWVHPLAAVIAIGSKFLFRIEGKHVFNPANFGVICAISLLPGAWISPGQWGNDLAHACWFVALGGVVTQRAQRADISWFFLATFVALNTARVLWLDQSWNVLLHQLQSGALLLFTFFMISDPMTIPNHGRARWLYAAIVAFVAFAWQFFLFKPNALVWALFLATPLVPWLDRWFPAPKHLWRG